MSGSTPFQGHDLWVEELADALWLASFGIFSPRCAVARVLEEDSSDLQAAASTEEPTPSIRNPRSKRSRKHSKEESGSVAGTGRGPMTAGGAAGISLALPAARALPGTLALTRALRPLMRRVSSRTQLFIDEEKTAVRVAESLLASDGAWVPELCPDLERWLDLAIVVDAHPSMRVWRETVRALELMLGHLGAFRDVRRWDLDTTTPAKASLRFGSNLHRPSELIDPSKRRVVVVVTDCLGPAWDSGKVPELLSSWARYHPVALLHMLPQRFWGRTALEGAAFLRVKADKLGAPNVDLARQSLFDNAIFQSFPDPQAAPVRHCRTPFPVLTLEPRFFAAWAQLLTGNANPRMPAVLFSDTPTVPRRLPAELSPEVRINAFRSQASPTAFQLVCLFAAAPLLQLPVMRLVQEALLPQSRQVHLAEVFLGGLLYELPTDSDSCGLNSGEPEYDFLPEVRDALLDMSEMPDSVQVQRVVSRYLEDHLGYTLDFAALLEAPATIINGHNAVNIPVHARRFAEITAKVLRRLGGEYQRVADILIDASVQRSKAGRLKISDVWRGAELLWVDDNPDKNVVLLEDLSRMGAEITTVESGESAASILEERSFDLIISDVQRREPAYAAPQLLQFVRQRFRIPFAIFSRHAKELESHALVSGALVCTNDFSRLRSVLTRSLRALRAGRNPEPDGFLSSAQTKRLLRAIANELIDPEVLNELIFEPGSARWIDLWRRVRDTRQLAQSALGIVDAVTKARSAFYMLNSPQAHKGITGDVVMKKITGVGLSETAKMTIAVRSVIESHQFFRQRSVQEQATSRRHNPEEIAFPIFGAENMLLGVLTLQTSIAGGCSERLITWLQGFCHTLGTELSSRPVIFSGKPTDSHAENLQGASAEEFSNVEGLRSLWSEIAASIRAEVGAESFTRWFKEVELTALDDNQLTLQVPNNVYQLWIESNYLSLLQSATQLALGTSRIIKFIYADGKPVKAPADDDLDGDKPQSEESSLGLNSSNTFESFVVGANNQFAHAACVAVAQSPGKTYNPLFFYGGVGLGKTHLMHAIGHQILAKKKGVKVLYISSERFTNEFIDAIQTGGLIKFRKRYRQADVLLIDDIQFLAGKERSQEEFFHTFNALFDGHKQIVLSSNRPPSEIQNLENRLVSRFEWGLTAELQPPDMETRVAILRKKAAGMDIKISNEILEFLAERIRTNVRRLEGALMRVASYVSLNDGQTPPMERIEHLLKDLIQEEARRAITIDQIQKRVADHFDVRLADMTSKRRPANIAFPRQIAMYLARELTKSSLSEIGEAFGGRDYGTVLHAHRLVKERIQKDEKTRKVVAFLDSQLQ